MSATDATRQGQPLSMQRILLCGAVIVTLAMGIRHGFGLWLVPITQEKGWNSETFSFAIAVQNLSWGIVGIFAGMLADRWGASRVIVGGGILYALGLCGMALSDSPAMFMLSSGILIGAAQAGTTYAVIFGIIGRNLPASKRSWAMGVTSAAGSFGQFFMVPVENTLINTFDWHYALLILAALSLVILPLALGLKEPAPVVGQTGHRQSIAEAVKEAFAYPSFRLMLGSYFVCGFQVVFIGVHMPTYLKDAGFQPGVATFSLALIGLFNVFGSYFVGILGQSIPRRFLLVGIYSLRAVAILIFINLPLSIYSVYVFSAVMGLLWLSTVPPTNAIIAQIFGVQHFSMLGGFVFFSHQIGSFLGVWLGGWLYDVYQSYQPMWYIAIALSVFAVCVTYPVKEGPIQRVPQAT